MTLWSQDNQGNAPDQSDLQQMATSKGFTTVPALGFTAADNSFPNGLAYELEADMYIPTVYHLAPDMTVLAADSGNTDPSGWL